MTETQLVISSTQPDGILRRYLHKLRALLKSIIMFIATCYGIPGVFLSPLFVIMIPAIFCWAVGWYTTVAHLAARAISDGLSKEDASFLLSLMGIGSLIGRAVHGWFIDRGFLTSETCLVVSLAVSSVCTYLVPLARFFPILCITTTILGVAAGIANTLISIMPKIMVKPSYENTAFGMLFLIWGFGDLTGGVVSGYLYDTTGNYDVSFYFAGTALAASTILVYGTCILKDRIVNKLYAKFALKQLHLSRGVSSSGDLLEYTVTSDNEYGGIDNEVFLEESPPSNNQHIPGVADDASVSCSGDQEEESTVPRNQRSSVQIEIHENEWERAYALADTNV